MAKEDGLEVSSTTKSTEMETIIEDFPSLHVFQAELPDPERYLAVQPCEDLGLFIIFQGLPLELRLLIWRIAFPERRLVFLNQHWREVEYYNQGPKTRDQRSFPITLWVNVESRNETLRHYYIVEGKTEKPFCFDPKVDRLLLQYVHYMPIFCSQASIVLGSITSIELRGMWWNDLIKGKWNDIENERSCGIKKLLLLLPNLRRLHLTLSFYVENDDIPEIKKRIRAFLERNKDSFKNAGGPELIVKPWKSIFAD